jgi:hypothetical protein
VYLIQIFLPLRDKQNRVIAQVHFDRLARELTERFGGLTAYGRAPAVGLWKKGGKADRDQIVIYEVLSARHEKRWWRQTRIRLQKIFRQQEILVRSFSVTQL